MKRHNSISFPSEKPFNLPAPGLTAIPKHGYIHLQLNHDEPNRRNSMTRRAGLAILNDIFTLLAS